MAIGETMAVVSAGLDIGSAIAGIFGSSKQKRQAKKVRREIEKQATIGQQRLSHEIDIQRLQNLQAKRSNRLQAIQQQREAAIRRAEILAAASNAGVSLQSSAIQGGLSSVQSNLGRNLGLIQETEWFGDEITKSVRQIQGLQSLEIESNRKVARAQSKAGSAASTTGMIQSAFNVGSRLAGMFAGPSGSSSKTIYDLSI